MEELLRKIDNHEDLSSQDYCLLLNDYKFYEEVGDDSRWTRFMYTVSKLGDRYFEIYWQKGLTEMQEDYWDYPIEVEFLGMETEIIKIERPIIKRKEDVEC